MPGDMKAKIADTLNEILSPQDLDRITVKELVAACGMSRQSFYYPFPDIMDVVEWYQNQALKQSIEKSLAAASCREALVGVIRETFQHRQLILQLMSSQRREEIELMFFKAIRTYLQVLLRAKGSHLSCSPADVETALSFCSCGLVGMMLLSLNQKHPDVDELAGQMSRLLTGEVSFRFTGEPQAL